MYREPNKKSGNDSPELASCNAVRQKQDTFRTVMMCQGFLAMPIFLWFSMGDFFEDSNDSTTQSFDFGSAWFLSKGLILLGEPWWLF